MPVVLTDDLDKYKSKQVADYADSLGDPFAPPPKPIPPMPTITPVGPASSSPAGAGSAVVSANDYAASLGDPFAPAPVVPAKQPTPPPAASPSLPAPDAPVTTPLVAPTPAPDAPAPSNFDPTAILDKNGVIAYVHQKAAEFNLDPAAVLSVANHEGLNTAPGSHWTLAGEGNISFGPPSWYGNGAGSGIIAEHGKDAAAWSWTPPGIDHWLGQVAQAASGLTGTAAVTAIVNGFERPREDLRAGEIRNAMSDYGSFQQPGSTVLSTAPAAPAQAQPTATQAPSASNPVGDAVGGVVNAAGQAKDAVGGAITSAWDYAKSKGNPFDAIADSTGQGLLTDSATNRGTVDTVGQAIAADQANPPLAPVGSAIANSGVNQFRHDNFPNITEPNHPLNQPVTTDENGRPSLDPNTIVAVGGMTGPVGAGKAAAAATNDILAAVSKYSPEIRNGLEDFVQQQTRAGQSLKDIGDTVADWIRANPPKSDTPALTAALSEHLGGQEPSAPVAPTRGADTVMQPQPDAADAQPLTIDPHWHQVTDEVMEGKINRGQMLDRENELRAQDGLPPIQGHDVTGAPIPLVQSGKIGEVEASPPSTVPPSPPSSPNPVWGTLAAAKKSLFSLSNFHALTIGEGTFFGPAGPSGALQYLGAYVKGLVKPGSAAARDSGDMAAWYQRARDAKLLNNVGVNPEVGSADSALSPLAQKAAQSAGGAIFGGAGGYAQAKTRGASEDEARMQAVIGAGIGAAAGPTVATRMHDALWTEAVPTAKVLTFKAAVEGGASDAEAAKFVTNLMGGQNLQDITSKVVHNEITRLVVLAPDWVASQLKLAGSAGAGLAKSIPGVEQLPHVGPMTGNQQLSRDWMLKTVSTGLFVTEALQYAFTGHFTDQNQPGNQFQLEIPTGNKDAHSQPDYTTVSLFPGNVQPLLDLANETVSDTDHFGGLGKYLSNRLGIAGIAKNMASNEQFPGGPEITPKGSSGLEAAANEGLYAASRYAPMAVAAPQQQVNKGAPAGLVAASMGLGVKVGHDSGSATLYRERDAKVAELTDFLTKQPEYQQATPAEQRDLLQTEKVKVGRTFDAANGLTAATRGLPPKYIGVNDPAQELKIDYARAKTSAYLADPRNSPRPTADEQRLALRYESALNPLYQRATQQNTQTGRILDRRFTAPTP